MHALSCSNIFDVIMQALQPVLSLAFIMGQYYKFSDKLKIQSSPALYTIIRTSYKAEIGLYIFRKNGSQCTGS